MNKKRFLFIFGFLLILGVSAYLSVYMLSKDNVENKNSGNEKIEFLPDKTEIVNWQIDGNRYTSLSEDSCIIFYIPATYVNNILINGEIKGIENEQFKIYYVTDENEVFSEEKSFVVSPSLSGGAIYLNIKHDIFGIKLVLFDEAGKTAELNSITINPTNYVFSFTLFFSILSFCIILLFFLALFIFRKRILANMYVFGRYKYLLSDLVMRDIKVKYRRSVLGLVWSVLNPLLMMLVITAVFSNIFKFDIKDFPIYYLAGILIFNFVSESTSLSVSSIVGGAGLIKKVYIPKYIFPLEKCMFAFVNMLFSLIAVAIVYAIIGVELHWTIILFPVPMLYAFVFSLGLSLILAAINVFFRDIGHLYSVWVTAWMYLTPIIYPASMLPESLMTIMRLNPLFYYVGYIRNVMIYGVVPDIQDNLICIGFAMIFFGFGLYIFKRTQDRFIMYI